MDEPMRPMRPRHNSFVGPIILIVIGAMLLMFKMYPGFNAWWVLWRYWPLILILIGLGKIWDSYYWRHHQGDVSSPAISGTGIAWILLLVFFLAMGWQHRGWRNYNDNSWDRGWGWHSHALADEAHDSHPVELQGAKNVDVDLNMPAGNLTVQGGSTRLADADFRYDKREDKPQLDYSVAGDHGQLRVSDDDSRDHTHWGTEDNNWYLRVTNGVPMSFHVEMGAGSANLRLNGVQAKDLDVHMGAGQLDLDLTGPRTTNVTGTIEGGVGQATIRLPKDVGVHVDASGGIGSVDAHGLRKEDGAWVNDAYGKSATSIELTVHGGVGQIELLEE
jgi:N-terminal domain of toast_rack, DUF2154/Domain of unknown function (DUF5668)